MKRYLLPLFPLALACCTQNQLILDPFDEGESLMVQDEEAIAEFEAIMDDVNNPEQVYKLPTSARNFFDSPDVLNTYQETQPILGICRSGEKEYYYHIEEDTNGTLHTDLDEGITDYIITPEKYEQIREYIRLHTPVPEDYVPEEVKEEGKVDDSEEDAEKEEE